MQTFVLSRRSRCDCLEVHEILQSEQRKVKIGKRNAKGRRARGPGRLCWHRVRFGEVGGEVEARLSFQSPRRIETEVFEGEIDPG